MIFLDKNVGIPMYEQLFEKLRQSILSEELEKDTKLKPIRILAEELNVSNNTVSRAYQQLLSEGYIRAIQGSGYYVEALDLFAVSNNKVDMSEVVKEEETLPPLKYDFRYESIEATAFPWSKWKRYMHNAIMEESYSTALDYDENKGKIELRTSLCQYINDSRGVKCTPDQIIICAGTQYAMDIITNILPKKKYRVGVEEPGYNGMRKIFTTKGYEIAPISITKTGVNIQQLEKSKCNLLYLTPSHQFPTGITTSLTERLQILDWAKRNQAYIIENDYDNEFSYGKKSLPSMQSLDKDNRVIYISTLSKVLSPSLRCAYFVLPEGLLNVYEDCYKYYYSALPSYNQKALADFIQDGHLERHVRKMSLLNRRKNEIFNLTMEEWLPEQGLVFPSSAGSHVLMKIPFCTDQEFLISEMRKRRIGIYGTKEYWYQKEKAPENIFLLGYNAISVDEMETACVDFSCALRDIYKMK